LVQKLDLLAPDFNSLTLPWHNDLKDHRRLVSRTMKSGGPEQGNSIVQPDTPPDEKGDSRLGLQRPPRAFDFASRNRPKLYRDPPPSNSGVMSSPDFVKIVDIARSFFG